MADEVEKRLAKMRQALVKLQREGREKEFRVVADAYARLKAEEMARVEREQREQTRARRAAVRAEEARVRPERWRLPAGFGVSPLAAQRAREGYRPREEPVRPAGGLNPWRRYGGSMAQQIWRP